MSLALCGSAYSDGDLNEIIVTATRIEQTLDRVPASISVVSGDEIQRARQQLGLDESLARVPGVFFQNRYNFAQDLRIAIRGFGARSNFGVRGIKIVIDGIPETLADGQSQVDSIDLSSVAQVEVLRGPSSALYGNAAGGVINILSERGNANDYVEVRTAAGDYGYRKHQFKTGGSAGRLDYLISLSDLSIDGYREHSKAENTQLNSRFNFQIDDRSTLSWTVSATDQPLSNDPGGVTFDDATTNPRAAHDRNLTFDAGEVLDQQKLGLSYRRTLDRGGEVIARNYYLSRDFRGRLPFTDGGVVAFDRFFAGGGISLAQPFVMGNYSHRLVVGVDYDRQRDDRRRFDNDDGIEGALTLNQEERVTSSGFFVQDVITVSEQLAVTLGLRYDNIKFEVIDAFLGDGNDSGSRTLNDLSPSIGFVYDASKRHSLYGNIATAFETPTSTEFARPDGGGGFNSSLEPQKSTSYELGLRGSLSATSQYEIAAFNIDVNDELIAFEIATNPGRDFFVNAGKSNRRGVELAVSAQPTVGLNLSLAYTWSRFEFETFVNDAANDFSGNTIPGVPRSFARAEVAYSHPSGFYAALDSMIVGSLYADNANSTSVGGSTITNLRFGYKKAKGKFDIEPFAGINNVGDEAYMANVRLNAFGRRYFEAGPDRNLYAGVTVRYRHGEH